ncbi:type II secretion system protein J [Iodidimonas nitroreducens]|uniref:Type II secretion system protein J n=1 Tax=Iodidimonas nitroreducens TaxID=1236968 RepID=A0A5A7N9Q4_9PROT|nr:prepilin-type N-terminal cleavage/methylation domain-containing protein [Iodidimonas nitroreducens]GER04657.1 type II secretion system protein J [Iodidimonas nitroreducens]
MMRQARSTQAGFTLVELIVALTLVGLLSAGLFTALRFTSKAWFAGEARISQSIDADAVRSFIRHSLSRAQAISISHNGKDQAPSFVGDRTSLSFASTMPMGVGIGGLYLFQLESGPAGASFTIDWALIRPDRLIAIEDGRERPRLLFTDNPYVEFRYFGLSDDDLNAGLSPRWYDRWQGSFRLPQLVEMRFLDAGGAAVAPDLIIAPMMAPSRDRGPGIGSN